MPSPDVTAYVPLTLVDLDAQDLIDAALIDVDSKLPEWTPREGLTELVLLEALALEASETVYALNRLPGAVLEVLLRLFGVERDEGAPPSASVTFAFADTAGHTIPAGTTVRLPIAGADPLDLVTTIDLVVAAGANTGTVIATGAAATLAANGIPAGTLLELVDALPYVNTVTLSTAAAGGRLPEDGPTYLTRASVLLSRLTTTLVRPDDFAAYVAQAAGVQRVRVLDLYNPATPSVAPGGAPGFVTVAIAGPGGSTIPATAIEALRADLRTRAHAGLTIAVVPADVTTVAVTVTVQRFATYTDATVRANVIAALSAYLDPDAWPFAGTVLVNEIIGRADAATGVDVVLSVTTPAADLPLAGLAPLARAGLITVNVTPPT